jgi:hypothetical protein
VNADPAAVVTWGTRPAVALEFSVNFGVFAGRDVAPRELERLGEAVLPIVPGVSIVSEHRFEVDSDSTVALHQVRVEVDHESLPPAEADVESLRARIAEALDEWLQSCLRGVSGQELTEAELLARDAVVDGVLDES